MTKVWITGTGAVTCVGSSPDQLWNAAILGQSGIKDGLGRVDRNANSKHGRGVVFALESIRQAMTMAGWSSLSSSLGEGDGLILGSTTGQFELWHRKTIDFLRAGDARESLRPQLESVFGQQSLGAMLDAITAEIGRPSKMALLSSACSAGTQAIGLASMWIEQGLCRRVLVGGTEVLSTLTIEGFKSLQLLSMEPCLPFDARRKGINLSEGAAFLTMEGDSAKAKRLARVSGYGLTTDSFHMTGPHPEGDGCFRALSKAVSRAGLKPSEISWVHAHGTGSELNDFSEGLAIRRLFGDHRVPVTSTKNVHGHALGASGAIEAVLCVEALKRQELIRTSGLEVPDPKIPVDQVEKSGPARIEHILKSTLGFGGINAAVVFSRGEA